MARELSIVYGSVTMGGASTDFLLDGKHRMSGSNREYTVRWRVVVVSTSEADFRANVDTLRDEFRVRRQRLRIVQGSATLLDVNPSTNNGYNAEPFCEKLGDVGDTGRSSVYECGVTVQMAADDDDALRDASFRVTEDEGKVRTLSISGEVTVTTSDSSALTKAGTKASALATTLRTTLGGTWDEELVTTEHDTKDKVCTFTLEQREIVYGQSAAGGNHTSVIRPTIEYERQQPNPGNTPGVGAENRATVVVSYSAGLDNSAVTDPHAFWESTLRDYVIAEAERFLQPVEMAVVEQDVRSNPAGSRITATLTLTMSIVATDRYTWLVTQRVRKDAAAILNGVWDGKDHTYHKYRGKPRVTRETEITGEFAREDALARVAGVDALSDTEEDTDPEIPSDVGQWALLEIVESRNPMRVGSNALEKTLGITLRTWSITEQYWEPVRRSVITGGGSPDVPGAGGAPAPTTPSRSGPQGDATGVR